MSRVPPDSKTEEAYEGENRTIRYVVCQELGLELARSKAVCQARIGWGSKRLHSYKEGPWDQRLQLAARTAALSLRFSKFKFAVMKEHI